MGAGLNRSDDAVGETDLDAGDLWLGVSVGAIDPADRAIFERIACERLDISPRHSGPDVERRLLVVGVGCELAAIEQSRALS